MQSYTLSRKKTRIGQFMRVGSTWGHNFLHGHTGWIKIIGLTGQNFDSHLRICYGTLKYSHNIGSHAFVILAHKKIMGAQGTFTILS